MSEDRREVFQRSMEGRLPGVLGVEVLAVERGRVDARLELRPEHLAPNDFIHAGSIVTLADTCCGMGCIATLPEGAAGFTTAELKVNFLRAAAVGATIRAEARIVHEGTRVQVWDATVVRESDGKPLALFRCTQYILSADDPRTSRQARIRAESLRVE
jgi:1,4-dihydroxy-2-naphthoyl-CoA hydrolase